jgi:hypothetical protein
MAAFAMRVRCSFSRAYDGSFFVSQPNSLLSFVRPAGSGGGALRPIKRLRTERAGRKWSQCQGLIPSSLSCVRSRNPANKEERCSATSVRTLRRHRSRSNLEGEVLVYSSAPGPFIGPGRNAEAAEGRTVIGGAIGQGSAGHIALGHGKLTTFAIDPD